MARIFDLDFLIFEELLEYLGEDNIANLISTCSFIRDRVNFLRKRCQGCVDNDKSCLRIKCYKCCKYTICENRFGPVNCRKGVDRFSKKCCFECIKCFNCGIKDIKKDWIYDCTQCGNILCLRCCADNRGKCCACRVSLMSLMNDTE